MDELTLEGIFILIHSGLNKLLINCWFQGLK